VTLSLQTSRSKERPGPSFKLLPGSTRKSKVNWSSRRVSKQKEKDLSRPQWNVCARRIPRLDYLAANVVQIDLLAPPQCSSFNQSIGR